ncbi:gasdermin Eb [Salarias fasciatus]|uniref:Gasdermin Eb n=1 Tax=Salarias fasciatus TaxID=181472 RepID=A0A672IWH2_SALFA|nr:gasdermin-E [Salarias fasciatus]XP_029958405.1 gasdermin-E [Salarias fasciatus]
MFSVATRNFVEEVDRGGALIPVCSLNEPISALSVVVKRKGFWFWQRPKYQPTDFNLSDLLAGDAPIKPDVIETDFIKYSGTFGDNLQGSINASFINNSVNVAGKDSSKLQSSFGSLKKEEVDVQKLLRACKGRVLDMSHCLIQQVKEKPRRICVIVKERIVTTQPCSVIEEVQQGGHCGGNCSPKISKFLLKENASLSKDSNVSMEIPPKTTIAYAVIELEIRHDGHFELCLVSDVRGGFEVDGPVKMEPLSSSGAQNSLQQELDNLKDHFQVLSGLPAATRSALLQLLSQLMQNRAAVSALQHTLEQVCLDKKPDLSDLKVTESQQQNIKSIVELLEQSGREDPAQGGPATSVLTAFHLLTSTLEELPDDGLAVLGMCCSPEALHTLERLVQCVSGSGETPQGGAELTQDIFEKTRHLFAVSNVSLKKEGSMLKTEITPQPGHLPLVVCMAVTSLASLARGV